MEQLLLDKEYARWIVELAQRYRSSQIKAAIKVNDEIVYLFDSGLAVRVENKIDDSYREYTKRDETLRKKTQIFGKQRDWLKTQGNNGMFVAEVYFPGDFALL